MFDDIVKLYEYLYQKVSGNRIYEFKPNNNQKKIIDTFINYLSPSHGQIWLFNFMSYQFFRYHDLKTRFGRGIVQLNWVIGKKALNKFNNASEEEFYMMEEFKFNYSIINILSSRKDISESYKIYLDQERKRFYGTIRGYIHCTELGLYDPINKNCMFCKNNLNCKSNGL
jgi:hypothetical protein